MGMTFLVVDDHAPMRGILRELLQVAYPQAEVLEAASAQRAREIANGRSLQLILLDVGLPDASGMELIPELRALLPACGVIVVSQNVASAYPERAIAAGADAYVCKDRLWLDLLPAIAGTFLAATK